jgi:Reverse transcriptase (RNA-dependent DNA polymerase)
METLPEYALELDHGEKMMSFDIQAGYRHFRLAPQMNDWFLFRYDRRFYRCIALPFGWGRSPMWFTQLMVPMVRKLRQQYRILAYLDDFLICPVKAGRVASMRDCRKATQVIDKLLSSSGLTRHPTKGEWVGSTRVEHLGYVIDSVRMRFYIAPRKIAKVHVIARAILRQARQGRRWVSRDRLRSFCGVRLIVAGNALCSLLHQESIRRHDQKAQGGSSIKEWESAAVSHQSIRDLQTWRKLASTETDGRPIRPLPTNGIMRTDAADMGFGGTLGIAGSPGDPGQWQDQGIWEWKDRAECISVRELKIIRMVLMGTLGERVKKEGITLLRLYVDNSSVVHVTNAFVASSRPMMRELRRLKKVLDELGLQLSSEWIPSVANKFADALSSRFSPGDLAVRQTLRRSVVDGMMAPLDSFPLRPLGVHPVFLRRQCHNELALHWSREETRLLCPPVELMAAVVRKLRISKAPALLLMPDWPRQAWYQPAIDMSTKVHRLPLPPEEIWTGTRRLNPSWRLLLLDVNLLPDVHPFLPTQL